MTALQKTFLMYTFVYFIVKGALCVGLYVALVAVEKDARMRFAKLRVYLNQKRADEAERWSTAYRLFTQREAERRAAQYVEPEVIAQSEVAAAPLLLESKQPIAA